MIDMKTEAYFGMSIWIDTSITKAVIAERLHTFNNKLIEHCAFCGTKEMSPKDELLCFKDVKSRYCVNCKGVMLKEDALVKLKRNQELWDEFLVQIFGGDHG